MHKTIMRGVTLATFISCLWACSDDTDNEPECRTAIQCDDGFICQNGACTPDGQTTPNVATDAGADIGSEPEDMGTNVDPPDAEADAAADAAEVDAAVDMGPMFPAAAPATEFATDIPMLVRGATALGDGVLAVGTTPSDFAPNESREGLAVHYGTDGTLRWAARFGDPSNDQFADAIATASGAVIVGGSRGYSVTQQNNNDALVVMADTTGLGTAYNFGTADNELLFAVFPGGSLAEWIAVGEYSAGGPRDGFVVGLDASLQPTFAARIGSAADEIFTHGVVVGEQLYLVGSTGTQGDNTSRRALVVRVTQGAIDWSVASARPGTLGLSAYSDPQGQGIVVAGSASDGTNTGPAVIRVSEQGAVSGRVWDVPESFAVSAIEVGNRPVLHGVQNSLQPFILAVDSTDTGSAALVGQGVRAVGFLRMPVVQTGAGNRIVVQGASENLVDLPYTAAPETVCDTSVVNVTSSPIPADAFQNVSLQIATLQLSGGMIDSPRTSTIAAPASAPQCAP